MSKSATRVTHKAAVKRSGVWAVAAPKARKAAVATVGQLTEAQTGKGLKFTHSRDDFLRLFKLAAPEKVEVIKRGIPASQVLGLTFHLNMTQEVLLANLGLSKATVARKAKEREVLNPAESERVLGMEVLIGQVVSMIEESGTDVKDFDSARWLSNWLQTPLPAFGHRTPGSYMDTIEGQKLVSRTLAAMQSGAYV